MNEPSSRDVSLLTFAFGRVWKKNPPNWKFVTLSVGDFLGGDDSENGGSECGLEHVAVVFLCVAVAPSAQLSVH